MRNFLFLILILCLSSCSKKQDDSHDILLRYVEEVLSYEEVVDLIPKGISPADSAIMFNSIVESWIEDRVISEFAEDRLLGLEAIESKVREYRRHLIVQEYLSRMKESHPSKIEEQKIKDYYDLHRKELKLEAPLIRGVFVKLNSDTRGKDEIRSLLTSDNPAMIDKLEQNWMDKALEYNYFRDKWVDWTTISRIIPFRFPDPEDFLPTTEFFETDSEDCTYYLQISDVLMPGEEQPYEYARSWISDLLTQIELLSYEKSLINSLIKKSLKEKKLQALGYDPLTEEVTISL